MRGNAKLIVAVLILGAGVAAALVFRREPATSADGSGAETLRYRLAVDPASESLATESPAGPAATAGRVAAESPLAPWSDAAAGTRTPTGTLPAAPFGQPLALPPHYSGQPAPAGPVSPAPPSQHSISSPPSQPRATAHAPSLAAPANTPDHAASTPRTHTIVDGDTLPDLAERYLGLRARHGEIYELNRERLRRGPDELPIGTVIKIPVPQAADPAPGSDVEGEADLVPIPQGLFGRARAEL